MLASDVDAETAGWLWDQALPYYQGVTPHPDDDLTKDAMIDDGDWSMDWPSEFAKRHGFSEKMYTDWPEEWTATFRNLGRWLDLGRAASI